MVLRDGTAWSRWAGASMLLLISRLAYLDQGAQGCWYMVDSHSFYGLQGFYLCGLELHRFGAGMTLIGAILR